MLDLASIKARVARYYKRMDDGDMTHEEGFGYAEGFADSVTALVAEVERLRGEYERGYKDGRMSVKPDSPWEKA